VKDRIQNQEVDQQVEVQEAELEPEPEVTVELEVDLTRDAVLLDDGPKSSSTSKWDGQGVLCQSLTQCSFQEQTHNVSGGMAARQSWRKCVQSCPGSPPAALVFFFLPPSPTNEK